MPWCAIAGTTEVNKRKFYQRIAGILDPARLQAKRVVVVGVGSGGSRVAAELGRLGVSLILVDRPGERLAEHNIVRHLLGYSSLGKLKLREVARCVAAINPATPLRTRALDVIERPAAFARLLAQWRPDVIAVCTDNEPSKHAINRAALALDIPQVGAGVYDGGIGGEIYRVAPGGACYGCIADHLQLDPSNLSPAPQPDYNSPLPEEPPSVSALNLDIEQIALLQCRMILEVLLPSGDGLSGLAGAINLCVFANRLVPGTFARPWHAEFYNVPQLADCLACGVAPRNIEADAERILSGLARRTAEFAS